MTDDFGFDLTAPPKAPKPPTQLSFWHAIPGVAAILALSVLASWVGQIISWYTEPLYMERCMPPYYTTWTKWVDADKVRLTIAEEQQVAVERAYWTGYEAGTRSGCVQCAAVCGVRRDAAGGKP